VPGRLRVLVLSVILAIGLAAAPVGTPSATAATKPSLAFTGESHVLATTWCGNYSISHVAPVLAGTTAVIKSRVRAAFDSVLHDATIVAAQNYNGLTGPGSCFAPKFKVRTSGVIFSGRYLSLAFSWTGDWYSASMDGVRTLNLDLRTGATVSLNTFRSDRGRVFSWAACLGLVRAGSGFDPQHSDGQDAYCPDAEYHRTFDGWTVSSKGITVYGEGDGGLYRATVGWSGVVKPTYAKAKKHTTRKVPSTVVAECGSRKTTAVVSVQGNLVTARSAWNTTLHFGTKAVGKKVGGKWRVTVADPAFGPGQYDSKAYVYFSSKNSTKAVKYVTYAYCAD
jgi:hypothetical protein